MRRKIVGPTPDQTQDVKIQVQLLSEVMEEKAISWSKVTTIVMKLLQTILSAHVK